MNYFFTNEINLIVVADTVIVKKVTTCKHFDQALTVSADVPV
jgi:hypothetical protein